MNAPVWLTVDEVAGHLRVSRMTVYRLVHNEELRARRFGRQFRIDARDLSAYVRASGTIEWELGAGGAA